MRPKCSEVSECMCFFPIKESTEPISKDLSPERDERTPTGHSQDTKMRAGIGNKTDLWGFKPLVACKGTDTHPAAVAALATFPKGQTLENSGTHTIFEKSKIQPPKSFITR